MLWKSREAVERAPRKPSDEAAEAWKLSRWRLQDRAPRGPKWRPPGSWAAVGRQMAAPQPLLGGSLGGLGGASAALGAVLGRPGGPREASGGSGGELREAILIVVFFHVLSGQAQETRK